MFMRLISVLLIIAPSAAEQKVPDDFPALNPRDLIDVGSNLEAPELFGKWMMLYKKNYGNPSEYSSRFKVFQDNMKKVKELNTNAAQHGGKVKFGLTKFADMTSEEFASTILMKDLFTATGSTVERRSTISDVTNAKSDVVKRLLPEELDWTKSNIVTPVKNQGKIGVCYIFVALAVLESRWAQKGNGLVSLSAEQVADCLAAKLSYPFKEGTCGLNGGTETSVYRYVQDKGGIASEEAYPYCVGSGQCKPCAPEGYDSTLCGPYPITDCKEEDSCSAKFDTSKFVEGLKVKSWSFESNLEPEIADALATKGPLSAGLDATDLQLYSEGILTPSSCVNYRTNHGVALVGYGTEGGTKYWKAKNSWGTDHGEDGYIRIVRDESACGIHLRVMSAELE